MATIKQFEVFAIARQNIIDKLGLTDQFEFQTGAAEYGTYVEVRIGDKVMQVPVTVSVAAHKYEDTEKVKAYSLEEAADEFQFELDERERKAAEKAKAKAAKEAEKAAAKASKATQ